MPTLAELKARTEAMREAGLLPPPGPPVPPPPPARVLPCVDLGERLPGQPCGSSLLRCQRHGDVTSRLFPCTSAQRCCQTCDDYRTSEG